MITSLFHWLTQSSIFTKLNLNFGILSLNVWGIWSFDKLKALFHWFMKDKANIIFLQETYSTPEVENVWKYQWRGELFFWSRLWTQQRCVNTCQGRAWLQIEGMKTGWIGSLYYFERSCARSTFYFRKYLHVCSEQGQWAMHQFLWWISKWVTGS